MGESRSAARCGDLSPDCARGGCSSDEATGTLGSQGGKDVPQTSSKGTGLLVWVRGERSLAGPGTAKGHCDVPSAPKQGALPQQSWYLPAGQVPHAGSGDPNGKPDDFLPKLTWSQSSFQEQRPQTLFPERMQ